jgi:hypothetical protein
MDITIKINDGEFKDQVKEVHDQDEEYFYIKEYKLEYLKGGMVPHIYQIEKIHCDILYEKGKLNSCLQDKKPCIHLANKHTLVYGREKRTDHSCGISWDCGRAYCSRYEPDNDFNVAEYSYLLRK